MNSREEQANFNSPPPPYEPVPTSAPNENVYPTKQGGYPGAYPEQGPANYSGYPKQPVTLQPHTQVIIANPGMADPPPDYVMMSIIVTLCCCWPIGLFAIMKALAARDAINRNDREGAIKNSKAAKKLSMWALGVGIVMVVLSVVFTIVVYAVWVIPSWNASF